MIQLVIALSLRYKVSLNNWCITVTLQKIVVFSMLFFFSTLAYLFLMSSDPNPDIRRIVLSNIAPSVKTLPSILARTRDVRDSVRKTAYTVMGEKIHIKALSIANRVRLLHDGLTDRSGTHIICLVCMVRVCCSCTLKNSIVLHTTKLDTCIVKSLKFVVAQFSWIQLAPLTNKLTSSTNCEIQTIQYWFINQTSKPTKVCSLELKKR